MEPQTWEILIVAGFLYHSIIVFLKIHVDRNKLRAVHKYMMAQHDITCYISSICHTVSVLYELFSGDGQKTSLSETHGNAPFAQCSVNAFSMTLDCSYGKLIDVK